MKITPQQITRLAGSDLLTAQDIARLYQSTDTGLLWLWRYVKTCAKRMDWHFVYVCSFFSGAMLVLFLDIFFRGL